MERRLLSNDNVKIIKCKNVKIKKVGNETAPLYIMFDFHAALHTGAGVGAWCLWSVWRQCPLELEGRHALHSWQGGDGEL